ncbi:MAG: ion transporter [Cyclobacteriaceae bacterium]|nr:ion transporter [Cyclobacteriaceae bacterium]
MKEWKKKLYVIIYEADTFWGKTFDVVLLIAIVLSILAVMLETVESIDKQYGNMLNIFEWVLTVVFTIEYILRVIIVSKPKKYIFSFYGIIDFLSIIPSYLGLFISGAQAMLILRSVRLLRVFRVFKLVRFLGEASYLLNALRASRVKILVFLGGVFILVVILGSVMYVVEGREHGFTSIPRSIYWAVVTLTTVGYGDIAPQTVVGQALATFIMILGYGIIAVPTGIVSVEMNKQTVTPNTKIRACPHCSQEGHSDDADYCKFCGGKLL